MRITYVALNEEDRVDKLLEEFVRTHKVKVPINRIGVNKYLFGMRLINAIIINGVLMVRVGGGFMSMTDFVEKHSPKEILQIKVKMAKEKKKLQKVIQEAIDKHKVKRFN
jgi:Growth-Arrest-Specific Protein 2 Domain